MPSPASPSSSPTSRESRRPLGQGITRWYPRLRLTVAGGSGFESTRSLAKWLLVSTAIGLVAGVAAITFQAAIRLATGIFLGHLVGYLPPASAGEGAADVLPMARPWLLPVVTTVGGLLSGIIVFGLAPEAEGHGTDAAIAAIHHHEGRVRARIPPIKLVASAITIGSGGSAGREGPTAQISAGFGSLLAGWLHLDLADRRIAVAAGIGSGIGAIFRAPLGGALLASEILYVHDLEVEAIIPALIASIVGYTVFGTYVGFVPVFGNHPELALGSPVELLYYAALGVLSGLGGLAYSRIFYGFTRAFHRLGFPAWVKPALGGLAVGFMGLALPEVLHMGYGWVQLGMRSDTLLAMPLWVVLILPLAKIVATSLSIGSGGSGGIFAPGMVIGGMLGASLWRLGHGVLPYMPQQPTAFVIIGMMALFGGIAHAPLAVMLMVAEMTGNLSLLAPAMIAVAVSTALLGDETIYRSQLRDRSSSPFHRVRLSFPMLSALLVRDAMTPPGPVLAPDAPVRDVGPEARDTGAIVVDDHGGVVGVMTQARIEQLLRSGDAAGPARSAMTETPITLDPEDTLETALSRLVDAGMNWTPVVQNARLVGRVTVRDVLKTYKATLGRSVRRAATLPHDTSLFEARLSASSPLVGRTLEEGDLPRDTLVVSITRDGQTIFPRAGTRIEADDVLMITTHRTNETRVRTFLEGARSTLT
jgi:chloride channel protein, CIC family